MEDETYIFEIEMAVRDYECDLQGIVNNAVYLNYLEHARHEYLKSLGLDFAALHREGIDLVLVRCELDYRSPLRSGERFAVRLRPGRESALRFAFWQQVVRLPGGEAVLDGKVVGTGVKGGRPCLPEDLVRRLGLPERPPRG